MLAVARATIGEPTVTDWITNCEDTPLMLVPVHRIITPEMARASPYAMKRREPLD